MPWAKVDDQWFAHRKVVGLSLEARGLWTTVLSWSCAQRTPHVPPHMARFLAGGQDVTGPSGELVDAGLWIENGEGWVIHDWAEYQDKTLSEKRAEAGAKGGKASGEMRAKQKEEANAKQTKHADEANDEAGALPDPALPDPSLDPSPPDGGRDSGEIDADDPLHDDASDEIADQFEQHFWPVYPPTNGRKPEKGKALTQWRKLTVEQRRRAVIGARNLAKSDTVPKYAHRFLRKDTAGEFPFDDWQQREGGGPEPIAPDACQGCAQPLAEHDDEACRIISEAS